MSGATFDGLAKTAEAEVLVEEDRKSDLALLRDLLNDGGLSDERRADFDDMLDRLQRNPARFPRLTPKQREYAESVADRHDVGFARRPSQRAENVVRGREVPTPAVLSRDSLKAALNARKGRP